MKAIITSKKLVDFAHAVANQFHPYTDFSPEEIPVILETCKNVFMQLNVDYYGAEVRGMYEVNVRTTYLAFIDELRLNFMSMLHVPAAYSESRFDLRIDDIEFVSPDGDIMVQFVWHD